MPKKPSINWREFPLLRLLLFFVAGIMIGEWLSIQASLSFLPWLLISLLLGLIALEGRIKAFRFRHIWGLFFVLWVFVFGLFRVSSANELNQKNHFAKQLHVDSLSGIQALIKNLKPYGNNKLQLTVQVKKTSPRGQTWQHSAGNLLWIVPFDTALVIGTELLGQVQFRKVAKSTNPAAFDFARYQHIQNVHFQGKGPYQIIGNQFSVKYYAALYREKLMRVLRDYLPVASNELAVGAALILGNRDEIQTDIKNAYTETGAIHVLAVSGLHVGFIAMGLGWLLQFGPFRKRSWKWARLVLILAGIWAFAFITGLSPSVQRAATMFSFLQIGMALDRKTSIYNALAASAFVLLAIQPMLIFDIGFQLSYLAVLGIIYFQPRIYKLLYPPNWLTDHLWKLTSVAIAAQLTTFPISLFYFHQFPVYFWLSGIVVVTTASFILGLGVLLFLASSLPFLGVLVSKALWAVIWMTNAFIFAVHELPGGLIGGVTIGLSVLILLYGFILFFAFWWERQSPKYLMAALSLLLIAGGINAKQAWLVSQEKELVVYHLYKHSLLDFFDGKTLHSWSDENPKATALEWASKNYRIQRRVAKQENWPQKRATNNTIFQQNPPFLAFQNFKILIVDRETPLTYLGESPQKIDMVLFRNAPRVDLVKLAQQVQADYWVLDGSNYPAWAARTVEMGASLDLNVYSTHENGALLINFKSIDE